MNLLLAILLIILEAIFEGLKLAGYHIASELIEFIFLSLVIFCTLAFISGINFPFKLIYIPLWKIIIGYILLRYTLFDYCFNLSAGLDLTYIGNTKLFDKILQWLNSMWGYSPVIFTKGVAGLWGVAWLTKWGNK